MRVAAVLLGAQIPPVRWLTDLVWIANYFVISGAVREPAVAATSLLLTDFEPKLPHFLWAVRFLSLCEGWSWGGGGALSRN